MSKPKVGIACSAATRELYLEKRDLERLGKIADVVIIILRSIACIVLSQHREFIRRVKATVRRGCPLDSLIPLLNPELIAWSIIECGVIS